jgi:RNA polymerase primary sigma factor
MNARRPDSLTRHLNEIGRVPLLTAAEEIHLGTVVQEWLNYPGGPDAAPPSLQRRGRRAKDRMVTANLRLVVSVARRFSQIGERRGMTLEDLVQEGTIGLVRGAEKFDPGLGYKFSTYAYWWIRQALTRALAGAGLVRCPLHIQTLLGKVRKATGTLASQGVHRPTISQLAELTGETPERLQRALNEGLNAQTIASLDAPAYNSDGTSVGELIAAPEADHLTREGLWDAAQQLRELLPDEAGLAELRAVDECSFLELGELLGTSRSSARNKFIDARAKLRTVAGDRVLALLAG